MRYELGLGKPDINLDEPRFDQSTYNGRFAHFFLSTNPLNIFTNNKSLNKAKEIMDNYRQTRVLPSNVSVDDLWDAKYLFDSTFHPDTKERMFLAGRMCAQLPCNLVILLGTFIWSHYPVLWQLINQAFNAIVNYTNRSGNKPISARRLAITFGIAITCSTVISVFLNSLTEQVSRLAGRLVPFVAVAVSNCINVPFMRNTEITEGIQLFNKNGENVGQSRKAAKSAIIQVIISRNLMIVPSMIITPLIIAYFDKDYHHIIEVFLVNLSIQIPLLVISLIIATPMSCAIFPQKKSIIVNELEEDLRDKLVKEGYQLRDSVYYNKGL